MAKRKVNKKVAQKRRKAPQAQQDQDQDQQGQDQPPREVELPRMSHLRLSQLSGPLSFKLAGGRMKDDA